MATNFVPTRDTYIRESKPTNSYGSDDVLKIKAETGDLRKGLIYFDLSGVDPAQFQVSSATLTLFVEDSEAAKQFNIYSLASGVAGWDENANWNTYDGSNAWNSPGASGTGSDYEAAIIGTVAYPADNPDARIDVTLSASRVNSWLGGSNSNYGLLIVDESYTDTDTRSLHSSAGPAGFQPYLTVELIPLSIGSADFATRTEQLLYVIGTSIASAIDSDFATKTVMGSVTVGSIPPIVVGWQGNAFLLSSRERISVALLVTADDMWRILDSGGGVETLGLSIERYQAYLVVP